MTQRRGVRAPPLETSPGKAHCRCCGRLEGLFVQPFARITAATAVGLSPWYRHTDAKGYSEAETPQGFAPRLFGGRAISGLQKAKAFSFRVQRVYFLFAETPDAPPVADAARAFRGSAAIGAPEQGAGMAMARRWAKKVSLTSDSRTPSVRAVYPPSRQRSSCPLLRAILPPLPRNRLACSATGSASPLSPRPQTQLHAAFGRVNHGLRGRFAALLWVAGHFRIERIN